MLSSCANRVHGIPESRGRQRSYAYHCGLEEHASKPVVLPIGIWTVGDIWVRSMVTFIAKIICIFHLTFSHSWSRFLPADSLQKEICFSFQSDLDIIEVQIERLLSRSRSHFSQMPGSPRPIWSRESHAISCPHWRILRIKHGIWRYCRTASANRNTGYNSARAPAPRREQVQVRTVGTYDSSRALP